MQHNVGAGQVEMKSPLVSGNSGQNPIVQELATHPSQPLSAIAAGSQNHTHTLSNDFTYFRLKAPVVAPAAPQAISSMGVPVTSAIHHAVAASFIVTGQGWDGDTRNPDEPSKREARIKHVLDCTLRDRHGLDLMSLETDRSQAHIASVAVMPDIEAFIRSDEKIIAVLNCAEVFGAPDSRNLFSKGFVQVAIIERSDSKGATRRLIVYSLSGNLACTLNEDVGQKFENSSTTETECCCFTKQRGYDLRMGSADYKYSVVSQSNSEITMLNIENSIVHVQVTKTKIDNLHAQNNPPAPVAASTFFFTVKPTSKGCCDDLCVCDDKSGGCGCRCPAFSCFGDCCDCCSSKKVTTNGGSRHVQYNNTIGRIFGYTSILNVGGVPKPVVAARDSEQGFLSASDEDGSASIVTNKRDPTGVPWQIRETRQERVVIEITYRSVLTSQLQKCHLVMNKATDTSRAEFVGDLAKYAQSDTGNIALAAKFANELLPIRIGSK